jgi:hypothetical protein
MNACRCVLVRADVRFVNRHKMEKSNLEQRYAAKPCVKLEEGPTHTYEKIRKAFGNDSLSLAEVQVFRVT